MYRECCLQKYASPGGGAPLSALMASATSARALLAASRERRVEHCTVVLDHHWCKSGWPNRKCFRMSYPLRSLQFDAEFSRVRRHRSAGTYSWTSVYPSVSWTKTGFWTSSRRRRHHCPLQSLCLVRRPPIVVPARSGPAALPIAHPQWGNPAVDDWVRLFSILVFRLPPLASRLYLSRERLERGSVSNTWRKPLGDAGPCCTGPSTRLRICFRS
jgi:hypothetical protein